MNEKRGGETSPKTKIVYDIKKIEHFIGRDIPEEQRKKPSAGFF